MKHIPELNYGQKIGCMGARFADRGVHIAGQFSIRQFLVHRSGS
jgi:hypothetical protein